MIEGAGEFVSGAVSSPAPIDLAKELGGTFIVLVNVMDESAVKNADNERFQRAFAPARNLLRLQKRDANFFIQVNTKGIPFNGFANQGELLSAGEQAAETAVSALKAAWEKAIANQR